MFRLWSTSHQQENDPLNHDAKINELKAAIGPLSGRSLQFCTDACFRRYLEARNRNLDKAKKMSEETLKWRSTYKPEEIRWREVACEGETGKVYRASFRDRSGRTVLILRPGILMLLEMLQNTVSIDNQMRHLVYLMKHFGRFELSSIFLDKKTFHKVKFVYPKNKDSVELMKQYFDEENLPIEFGGPAILNYDHEEFSKLMNQDDVKSAAFWCPDDKLPHWANERSGAEVAPEPVSLTPAAS
ncbi:random slug protein 5-like [Pyrus ussuriensis x Pyrus communis]|uniref:Random slug protein 5-like n=1 Tax=Pyrus ussuriensis x Pyrus communis TaxID=2448454 RepID=A0A5N5H7H0_9ROSA|nr:random slug protein 5-like [Pyrus ussuriensis x Pyrus communis]